MDLYDFYTKILKIKNKEILKELVALSKNKYYDKGKNIFKYDDEVTHTQFLVKGIIRGYFLDENGNEITDCFCTRCGSPTVIRYGSEIIP